MVSPPARRSKTAVGPNRVRQLVNLDEPGTLHTLDDQLRDPVAAGEAHGLARIEVDHDHLDLAAVPSVDGAW